MSDIQSKEPVRTLLVAVGGTGAKMASAMCERLRDTHGCVPDFVQVVVVDAQQSGAEVGSFPALPSRTEVVRVNPIDYPAEAARLREAGELSWWPQMSYQAATNEVNFSKGCGAHRANGHFFARYFMDRIQRAIKAGINQLRLAREGVAEGSLDFRAFVLGSLGNGTGGGAAITVGAMTTQLLDQFAKNPSVYGAFVTSDVTGDPMGDIERQRVVANGVAHLLELEHEFKADRGRLNYEAISLSPQHGRALRVQLQSHERPFKQVYLFSGDNRSARKVSYEEVVWIAGRSIAAMVGGVDQTFRGLDKAVHTDSGTFSSLGHASLTVPRKELREYANLLARASWGDNTREIALDSTLLNLMVFPDGTDNPVTVQELLSSEKGKAGRSVQHWDELARFLCRGVFGVEEGTTDASPQESDQLTRLLEHYLNEDMALFDLGEDSWTEPPTPKAHGEEQAGAFRDAKAVENDLRAHVDDIAKRMRRNVESLLGGTGRAVAPENTQSRTRVRAALQRHGIRGVIDAGFVLPLLRSGNIESAHRLVSALAAQLKEYVESLEQIESNEIRMSGLASEDGQAVDMTQFASLQDALSQPMSGEAMAELDGLQSSLKRLWNRRRIVVLEQEVLGQLAEAKLNASKFLAYGAAEDVYDGLLQHLNQRIGRFDELMLGAKKRMSSGGRIDQQRQDALKTYLESVSGEGINGELVVCDIRQARVLADVALDAATQSNWLTDELAGQLVHFVLPGVDDRMAVADFDSQQCIAEVAEARSRALDVEVRRAAQMRLDVDVVLRNALDARLVEYVRDVHGMEDLTESELAKKSDFVRWAGDVGSIHPWLSALRDLMDDDPRQYSSVEGWQTSERGREAVDEIRRASVAAWYTKLAQYGSALMPIETTAAHQTQKRFLFANDSDKELGAGIGLSGSQIKGALNRLQGDLSANKSKTQSSSEAQVLDIVSGIRLEDLRNSAVLNLAIYQKIVEMASGEAATYLPHPTQEYTELGAQWLTESTARYDGAGFGHAPLMLALAMCGHDGNSPSPLAPLAYISEHPYTWTRDVKASGGTTVAVAGDRIRESLANVVLFLEEPANRALYEALQERILAELRGAAFGDPDRDLKATPLGIDGLVDWLDRNRPGAESSSSTTASVRNLAREQWIAFGDRIRSGRALPDVFGA